MKVAAGDAAAAFAAKPPKGLRGALVFGEDATLVAELRDRLLAALLGPGAADEMRLTELPAAALRSDQAALDAALRSSGFFPGPRATLVADAADGLAEAIGAALAGAATPDSALVVTAGDLKAKSALRRLFEESREAAALPCPAAAPDRRALAALLAEEGVADVEPDALLALETLTEGLDRGQLRRFAETLALHHHGMTGPLTAAEAAALAPAGLTADLDGAVAAVAEGRPGDFRRAAARLAAQGVTPVSVAIAAARHFRTLHALAAAGDPEAAAQRMRPPLWGPRRDAAIRQARRWGLPRIERALAQILALDADLRGGAEGPKAAMLERCLLRIALTVER